MSTVFRHLTLNRIAALLFVVAVALLVTGVVGALLSVSSSGSASAGVAGLSAGQALLLGVAGLVGSAVLFALAATHERLTRIEAKLDALARGQAAEESPVGHRV
jgi:hypothetical protein